MYLSFHDPTWKELKIDNLLFSADFAYVEKDNINVNNNKHKLQ